MLVSLCGFGETLIPADMPDIIYNILKQGHFVNVTNNGTMSSRFNEIIKFPPAMLKRLCFSFSLHYIELKRTNNLQTFIDNVKMVKAAGCSILVQLNLADEYISCMDEIKEMCLENFGAYPQVALTRKEEGGFSIYSNYTNDEYIAYGKTFRSPLFDFTCKNFNVKRSEFCYAGDWSFVLDLGTGDLKSCYFSKAFYNIYDKPNEKIKALAVGSNCHNSYCVNSSHFMALGVIPSISCPSYADLRNREEADWYTKEMNNFLNTRLYEGNKQYSLFKKLGVNIYFKAYYTTLRIGRVLKKGVHKVVRLK